MEAQNIIKKANKQRVQIIEEAKANIQSERNKIIAQTKIKINIEYQRAREELRKEIAMLVILSVEKIIGRSVDTTTTTTTNNNNNNDIINRFINELQ